MKLKSTNDYIELVFRSLNSHQIVFDDISYFDSYFEFVEFFNRIEEIDYHSLVVASYFTYGWMPTILKKFNLNNNTTEVLNILTKIKHKKLIDKSDYIELVKCVNNSIVGVSKLIHFINPTDYPIFDSRIKNYFKKNDLQQAIWGPTYQNKDKDIEQYLLYKDICLEIIKDSRFNPIYEESIKKLGFNRKITKMRVLENLFFTLGKN